MSRLRIPRRRPSVAMIVACCALFVALGGTSYALAVGSIGTREIRDDSIRSIDVHNRSLKGNDLRADSVGGGAIKEETLDVSKLRLPASEPPVATDAALLQALIYDDGSRFHARGVQAVNSMTPGIYQIVFDRDVSDCVPAATLTGLAHGVPIGGWVPVAISAYGDPNNAKALYVTVMRTSDGYPVQRDFHLLVSC